MTPAKATSTQQIVTPIDPTPIIQSESPTAVILAIAILISILIGSITGLVQMIVMFKNSR
jgi:hypothetical protein